MSESSERVKTWRKATKQRMIDSMGGSCVCCGYNRCNAGLSLHRLDPQQKELSFGKIIASPVSWDRIVQELRKCILVCLVCHAEIHAQFQEVPKDCKRFDESFAVYKMQEEDACPICGKMKPVHMKTCSRECAGQKAWKVDWDTVDLKALIEVSKNWTEIGDKLGVTGTAVKKRAVRLGLI